MRSEHIRPTRAAGPPIPKIRLLGRSWYRRGPGYWARRAGLTFVYLVSASFAVLIGVGLVTAILSHAHGVARVIVTIVIVGIVAASYTHAILASTRRRRRRHEDPPSSDAAQVLCARRQRAGLAGIGTGLSAYGGSAVGGALLAFGSVFLIGSITMMVLDSLGTYLNDDEYFDAQKVHAWKTHHPDWQP